MGDLLPQLAVRLARVLLLLLILKMCISDDLTIVIDWRAIVGFVCLAGTYLVSWYFERDPDPTKRLPAGTNPYKGQRGRGYLSPAAEERINTLVSQSVLYNADKASCLKRFQVVKSKSECIFAAKAKLWGSQDFNASLSLEENIRRMAPTFYKFSMAFQDLNLDAFVIELPGDQYGKDIQIFGSAVRRVLMTLRQADVERERQLLHAGIPGLTEMDVADRLRVLEKEDSSLWGRRSWVFKFNKVTFFLTTFAAFYPASNSRYSHGSEHAYILLQPEITFAIHDLPDDTAETNWEFPVTVRDKIRVAFREAGRGYDPPMSTQLPMASEVVKSVESYDEVFEWWKNKDE